MGFSEVQSSYVQQWFVNNSNIHHVFLFYNSYRLTLKEKTNKPTNQTNKPSLGYLAKHAITMHIQDPFMAGQRRTQYDSSAELPTNVYHWWLTWNNFRNHLDGCREALPLTITVIMSSAVSICHSFIVNTHRDAST